MSTYSPTEPLVLELDDKTWGEFLDRFEAWLGNLLMTQAAFRHLAEDTVGKIHEPHIKKYLSDIAETAKEHERKVEELYRLIGREPPSTARKVGGAVVGKLREGAADVQDALGGAVGGWKDLRQLLLANLDAMGAFAITEQLGLALGLPEVVDVTFPAVNEESTQQLLLQEYVLEMASTAILYHASA